MRGVFGVDAQAPRRLRRCPRFDVVHRHGDADPAGGADEHAVRRQCSSSRSAICGHLFGVAQSLLAGAGVGVAGIDDDGLRVPFFIAPTQTFTGAAQTWLVVNIPATVAGRFGNDQREVALLAFVRAFAGAEAFDVAKNAAGEKAFRRNDGTGISNVFSASLDKQC